MNVAVNFLRILCVCKNLLVAKPTNKFSLRASTPKQANGVSREILMNPYCAMHNFRGPENSIFFHVLKICCRFPNPKLRPYACTEYQCRIMAIKSFVIELCKRFSGEVLRDFQLCISSHNTPMSFRKKKFYLK